MESGNTSNPERGSGRAADHQKTIVVVEDNADIRDLLTVVFEDAGYRVIPLADGLNVHEIVRETHPSLVTLDLALPHVDGVQVLSELKEDPETRRVPVVVISAYTQRLPAEAAKKVASIIGKPFDIYQVLDEVERLTNDRAANGQARDARAPRSE